jgi:hypothetical protein
MELNFRLYRGVEGHTIDNPLGQQRRYMCLAQAALTNGAQVMTTGSTMALVIQVRRSSHMP